jgi:hypothetical protein
MMSERKPLIYVKPKQPKVHKADKSNDPSVVKQYTSRNKVSYDCVDSAGEDDYEETEGDANKDTGAISVMDTKGNEVV